MRVVVIRDKPDQEYYTAPNWILKVGDFHEVIREIKNSGQVYYVLGAQPDTAYRADYFAPLSDIDETELVNEKEVAV